MNVNKWLEKYEGKLSGRRVALFGSTGGIGSVLCRYILRLGGSLILVNRNAEKMSAQAARLSDRFPGADIRCVLCDLADIDSVKTACTELNQLHPDTVIHNAGAYSIPRHTCKTGYDNVFQINFVSPYYITSCLSGVISRVVAVGSIAHTYSKTDPCDVDFKTRKKASLVYGNAKRYLMFSIGALADDMGIVSAVTHPGITLTGITAHYPKLIFAIIRYPMKVIFMSPEKAALSVLQGLFDSTTENEWIGPRLFDIWGMPAKKRLDTCDKQERQYIINKAKEILSSIN